MVSTFVLGQGSFRLFRLAGIEVYLHWTWFVWALWEFQSPIGTYRSAAWNVLEYLALFAMVTLHEFGHALACRSTGGHAERIVLWPLGGLALVNPPQRPAATLWSVAAGPLVNVALIPALIAASAIALAAGVQRGSNPAQFLHALTLMNVVLLVFNLLPSYPLDGGQILRSLLWFVMGRARSLIAVAVIGFLGAAGLALLALTRLSFWFGLLAAFMAFSCWRAFQNGRALLSLERLPRRPGAACPACGSAPPLGRFWKCNRCGTAFDTFETAATCPSCSAHFANTRCVDCGAFSPMERWTASPAAVVPSAF
ncbi:MAG TPA: site-2 protease family protein [Vicinamibacteria bacterium]|nr:site-2 protease family protein [Vicinamibacteria bacterium]